MMKIDKLLSGIQKNILLKNFTTFKIGGRARYFFVAKTKENLIKTIKMAKELNPSPFPKGDRVKLPFFVLGGGSNLLVRDNTYNGLVIKILFSKFYFLNSKIIAEAGTRLGDLVNASVEKSLTGLEWAAGIPGTIGGAVQGNAGAFGKSMKDVVERVEVFDVKNKKIKFLKNKDCKFDYKDSIFKKNKNLIILSAELQFKKGNKNKITEKIKKYLEYKKNTQPLNFPSAGSVFKNPDKDFAAKLIEKCGLKGKKIGNAKISEKHANFIVNLGSAQAKDVKKLIKLIKQKVKNKFGVVLEEEIQFL